MRKISILALILALSSCSYFQSYFHKTKKSVSHTALKGNYTEEKKGENSYYVGFNGEGSASLEKAKDYAMLRSAEVTLENDFIYFKIDSSGVKYAKNYIKSCHKKLCKSVAIKSPQAFNLISCFKEKTSETSNYILYDAKAVMHKIRLKYKIKIEESEKN